MIEQDGQQDFFISHASADKSQYIEPLTQELSRRRVTYWLDTLEISWGDSFVLKINEGLRQSRYVLLCLSRQFIERQWTETELNAALAMQNSHGVKKVLPLILNSKDLILKKYPIIAGLIYRSFEDGLEEIGSALQSLTTKSSAPEGYIRVAIESIHTGHLSNLEISPRVSVKWLAKMASQGAGLRDTADVGAFDAFPIRWVLVDSNAELDWQKMRRSARRRVHAIIKGNTGLLQVSTEDTDRLQDIGVYDGIVFHLYAIEDDDSDQNVRYSMA